MKLWNMEGFLVQLKKPIHSDLTIGKIVVLCETSNIQCVSGLRLIEFIDENKIRLSPVSIMYDDDQISEQLSIEAAHEYLYLPIFEIDDKILFHNRPGRIVSVSENDYHIRIVLEEFPDKEIYTNLIHLDFSPSIERISGKISNQPIKEFAHE